MYSNLKHDYIWMHVSVALVIWVAGLQAHSFAKDVDSDQTFSHNAILIWPDFAPGETTKQTGTKLPPRDGNSSITRIEQITSPTMTVVAPENPNGAAVVILPGGGFRYTVPDKEGTEAAAILNKLGITAFVLNYRVCGDSSDSAWKKPAQDSQRAIRWIRANAEKYGLNSQQIGLLGFSAGGQAAAAHMTAMDPLYDAIDLIDEQPYAPDFAMLIYPWQIEDENGRLKQMIRVTADTPPAFIVSTHDDKGAVSTGAAKLYIKLKDNNVDAELHIYRSGGHGYGVGRRKNSVIHQWPDVATDWLRLLKLAADQ